MPLFIESDPSLFAHRSPAPRRIDFVFLFSDRFNRANSAMELSHRLTLNEEALQQVPEAQRPLFVYEWLRFLEQVLVAAQKVKILSLNQQ